jgi:4-alpha-glucanotransferase
MADEKPVPEVLTLARLCGIQPEFEDIFEVSRCVTLPTMQALLTAMGVSCATPGEVRESLSEIQETLERSLLPPVTVVTPETGPNLKLRLEWPRPEMPAPLNLAGELWMEGDGMIPWQPRPDQLMLKAAAKNIRGYLLELALPLPAGLAHGYYDLKLRLRGAFSAEAVTRLAVSPGRTWLPPVLADGARLWGINLPLYAIKSRRNWGIGDFTDLMAAIGMGRDFGAAFVGVNPLHAPQEGPDAGRSPYSPTSRLFLNFLILDLAIVPELQESPEAQALLANPRFQADLDRLRELPLVDYPEVRRLKEKVLKMLFAAFTGTHGLPEAPLTPRGQEFAAFVARGGLNLWNFTLFQALSDHLQEKDWRRWPDEFKSPDRAKAQAFARQHGRDLAFHQYVQWLAAEQRQAVWTAARQSGLPFTLYQDMALGAAAGGFESWGYPGLFAAGVSMGAPPDAFNPKGQNWNLPPMIPRQLAETRFALFIDTLRANLPPGGIVRLDHVMALFRLYWIPDGMDPQHGTYINYPSREFLALLALESQRRRTLVIGEDLGTVAPSIRRDLERGGIFSYKVFYFERTADKKYLPPEAYPRQALACITTHDLPTLAGYWEGRDLAIKSQLNIYPSPHDAEEDAASRVQDRLFLVEALVQRHLLPRGYTPPADFCPEDIRRAVLAYVGESNAALMEVRLEELLGLTAQQNLPGTMDQHPNWQIKIFQAIEEMQNNPELVRLAETLRQARLQQDRDDG